MEEFSRIRRLPPYVFNITGELKAAARKRELAASQAQDPGPPPA